MWREEALPLRHLEARRQLLLPLRPAVLEPGLDLDLGEVEGLGELHALADAQVLVDLEFALQALELLGAVGLAGFPVQPRFS